MYAMFSNDCGLVLTGHEVYTDRFTQDGNRRSLYQSLSAIVTQKVVTCKQRHFAVNEKWLTICVSSRKQRDISQLTKTVKCEICIPYYKSRGISRLTKCG